MQRTYFFNENVGAMASSHIVQRVEIESMVKNEKCNNPGYAGLR